MFQTTVRRNYPTKPVRTAPVTKEATPETSLQILRAFYMEARKEIRKRECITMTGKVSPTECDSVSFMFDTFSVTIDFTKGFAV